MKNGKKKKTISHLDFHANRESKGLMGGWIAAVRKVTCDSFFYLWCFVTVSYSRLLPRLFDKLSGCEQISSVT